jgi:hypothetical protein
MTMTKKYAICNVHAVTGNYITILNMEEFCLAMCDIDIIEESDDYYYIRNVYDEKYDNRYVNDKWLRNNGYMAEIIETFGGAMTRYTNKVKGVNIEIIFDTNAEIVGYHVKFSKPMKTMEINDRGTLLTVENFNVMFNLFI